MSNLWFVYLLVSLLDLIFTGFFLSSKTEANPLASYVWDSFGYVGIVFYKIIIVFFIIKPSVEYISHKNFMLAKAMIILGIFLTSLTCLLFGAILYEK